MAGSFERRLCLLVQGQWEFMLCLSLRECMKVTNSVNTKNKSERYNSTLKCQNINNWIHIIDYDEDKLVIDTSILIQNKIDINISTVCCIPFPGII